MIGDHQGRGEATTLALASGVQHVVKAGLPPLVEHHKYDITIKYDRSQIPHCGACKSKRSAPELEKHELQVATALQKSVGVAHAIKVNR